MPKLIVRFGSMRALGVLSTRGSDRFRRGERVVARTQRGLEVGEVLCDATEDAVAQLDNPPHGQILRRMTADDENELAHILSREREEFEICQQFVKRLRLQMDLVDVEHIFGGERIVVYYLAEQRVDFRELVKQLASEFQTRIEMRQIGVRDEAKLLADYGDCGKPVCCNTHLSQMPPVSMKMAKVQKATLDPTKISGRCGRLKCCLRYEFETYEEFQKELPPVGSDIVTANGQARILSQEILAQQLLIQTEDNRRMLIDASEVLTVTRRGSGRRGNKDGRGTRKNPRSRRSEGSGEPPSGGGDSPPDTRARRPQPKGRGRAAPRGDRPPQPTTPPASPPEDPSSDSTGDKSGSPPPNNPDQPASDKRRGPRRKPNDSDESNDPPRSE